MQAVAFEPPRSYLQWISNPSLNYSSKLAIAYEPWHSKAFMSTKFNNPDKSMNFTETHAVAAIAQLGERQTEDLKVPGSIPGLGMCAQHDSYAVSVRSWTIASKEAIDIGWQGIQNPVSAPS